MSVVVPQETDQLLEAISQRYSQLSKRLQQIARFALEHPNDMALQTIAVISERADVQPSALVRFAKAFGYKGFSDMQRVFQTRLAQQSPSYNERIRAFREKQGASGETDTWEMLREFAGVSIVSLEHLPESVDGDSLQQAVELLVGARSIHLMGQRRSFAVAAYLSYVLSRVDRYAHLLDGLGGMLAQQASSIAPDDVLIAISFPPYAPETAEVVVGAVERGTPVIGITDSPLSPLASHADVCFQIHDAELHGFRSLTASLCLAQTLAMGLGLELDRVPTSQ